MIPITLFQTTQGRPDVSSDQAARHQLEDHDAEAAEEGQAVRQQPSGEAIHATRTPGR